MSDKPKFDEPYLVGSPYPFQRLKEARREAMRQVFVSMPSPATIPDLRKLRKAVGDEKIETVDHDEVESFANAFRTLTPEDYVKKGTTKEKAALNLVPMLMRVQADRGMQIGLVHLHRGDLKGDGGPEIQLEALREYKIPRAVLLRLLEETPEEKTA